jgi:hypothetical protein
MGPGEVDGVDGSIKYVSEEFAPIREI